ncbi:MAG: hypothetical protein ACXITV_07285 [Luteibaculaceae bacterium]
MKYEISFQERAKLGMEQLSNQLPVSLLMARQQIELLKQISSSKNKKKRS